MIRDLSSIRQKVLKEVIKGNTTKEICKNTGLKTSTIEFHIRTLFYIFNVRNRTELTYKVLTMNKDND